MSQKPVKVWDVWPEAFDCNLKNKKTMWEIKNFINDSLEKAKKIKSLCLLGFTFVEIRHGIESIIARIQKSTKGSKEVFLPSFFFKKIQLEEIIIPDNIKEWFGFWDKNIKSFNNVVEKMSKENVTKTQLIFNLSSLSHDLMFLINMCKAQAKEEESTLSNQ